MRELEEVSRALWLSHHDSGLSIDRPLFGQHAASAYLDPSSPPPTPAEIHESFAAVIAIAARLGLGDMGGEDTARFGRRLAHRLSSPMLPRIRAAGRVWRDGREQVLVTRTVNWLGITRAEAAATDLGTRISDRLGPPAVLADVRRELNGLWGGSPYQNRDQLLGVSSAILAGIARGMLEASIENETRLDAVLAGADLLHRTDPDERDAAVASLDAAFDYVAGGEFDADDGRDDGADDGEKAPFDERVMGRQLAPFSAAADVVVKLLVELGAMLRAFEVVQTRTDAMASILTDLMTVHGTSSAAIQRGNRWTHDLLVVSGELGLILRQPTPPQALRLDEFLGGFANASTLRSGVAGLAGALAAPAAQADETVWQARLARVQRVALAQKHLPTTWTQVPGLAAGPDAPPAQGRRGAALRLRGRRPSRRRAGCGWPRSPGRRRCRAVTGRVARAACGCSAAARPGGCGSTSREARPGSTSPWPSAARARDRWTPPGGRSRSSCSAPATASTAVPPCCRSTRSAVGSACPRTANTPSRVRHTTC